MKYKFKINICKWCWGTLPQLSAASRSTINCTRKIFNCYSPERERWCGRWRFSRSFSLKLTNIMKMVNYAYCFLPNTCATYGSPTTISRRPPRSIAWLVFNRTPHIWILITKKKSKLCKNITHVIIINALCTIIIFIQKCNLALFNGNILYRT